MRDVGSTCVPTIIPMARRPVSPAAALRAPSTAAAAAASDTRACSRNAVPAAVGATPRGWRSSSRTPSSDSSARTWALSAGWERCSRTAARDTLPSSATATK
jgi:hypothetical protein